MATSGGESSPSKLPLPAERRAILEARMQGFNVASVADLTGVAQEKTDLFGDEEVVSDNNSDSSGAAPIMMTVGAGSSATATTSSGATVVSSSSSSTTTTAIAAAEDGSYAALTGSDSKKRPRRKQENPQRHDHDGQISNDGLNRKRIRGGVGQGSNGATMITNSNSNPVGAGGGSSGAGGNNSNRHVNNENSLSIGGGSDGSGQGAGSGSGSNSLDHIEHELLDAGRGTEQSSTTAVAAGLTNVGTISSVTSVSSGSSSFAGAVKAGVFIGHNSSSSSSSSVGGAPVSVASSSSKTVQDQLTSSSSTKLISPSTSARSAPVTIPSSSSSPVDAFFQQSRASTPPPLPLAPVSRTSSSSSSSSSSAQQSQVNAPASSIRNTTGSPLNNNGVKKSASPARNIAKQSGHQDSSTATGAPSAHAQSVPLGTSTTVVGFGPNAVPLPNPLAVAGITAPMMITMTSTASSGVGSGTSTSSDPSGKSSSSAGAAAATNANSKGQQVISHQGGVISLATPAVPIILGPTAQTGLPSSSTSLPAPGVALAAISGVTSSTVAPAPAPVVIPTRDIASYFTTAHRDGHQQQQQQHNQQQQQQAGSASSSDLVPIHDVSPLRNRTGNSSNNSHNAAHHSSSSFSSAHPPSTSASSVAAAINAAASSTNTVVLSPPQAQQSNTSSTSLTTTSSSTTSNAVHPEVQRIMVEATRFRNEAYAVMQQLQEKVKNSQEEITKLSTAVLSERDNATNMQRGWEQLRNEQAARLAKLMRQAAQESAQAARRFVADSQVRLGRAVAHRSPTGTGIMEVWENGDDIMKLEAEKSLLEGRLEELERNKKEIAKRNKKLRDTVLGGNGSASSSSGVGTNSASSTGATATTKGKGRGKTANNVGNTNATTGTGAGSEDDDEDDEDPAGSISSNNAPGPFGFTSDFFGGPSGTTLGALMGIGAFGNSSGNNNHNSTTNSGFSSSSTSSSSSQPLSRSHVLAELELTEAEESVKVAITGVKRDLEVLEERRKALDTEKQLLIYEMKRQKAERESKYKGHVTLGADNRYLLLSLLGKGGFSEVWRALDLWEMREVAVKVHQLASHWHEEKKQNYVRHALREYQIQSSLVHPHIVQLLAVIEIDADCFATVLEYCRGTDLDRMLKENILLPEREARAIVIQVLSALRYLNGYVSPWDVESGTAATAGGSSSGGGGTAGAGGGSSSSSSASGASSSSLSSALTLSGNASSSSSVNTIAGGSNTAGGGGQIMPPPPARRKIIHYDLKPANILFDEYRRVKVTDFGLSKILDDTEDGGGGGGGGGGSSMELTSQGAGTYWYLPPECFESGNIRISNKVDVWSIGIIFYQTLYGKKPFGEGQTQEAILQQNLISASSIRDMVFPAKPNVSDGAKNFIRRCLTPRQDARPDVLTICEDPYLRQRMAGAR